MAKLTWEELAGENSDGEYKQKTGFDPLPEGTRVLQTLEEIKLDSFQGSDHEHLNIKWRIEAPEEFNNRVYFQSIYINGSDPTSPYYDESKQDKNFNDARRMLFAIDYNAGKKIAALKREPTQEELQEFLIGARMMAVLGVSKTGKQVVRGISGIDPAAKEEIKAAATKSVPKFDDSEEDLIPF